MSNASKIKWVTSVLALTILASRVAPAIDRIGGSTISASPEVRFYDDAIPSSPVLVEHTETLTQAGSYVIVHDGLFVAEGLSVRLYDRLRPDTPALATWSAGSPILGLADGPERGLVLVLDANGLHLVRFDDFVPPAELWWYPIDQRALKAAPGRLVVRDGSLAYVADASVPGIRVLSVDPLLAPATVAIYESSDGILHHLTLWDRTLTALTNDSLIVLDAGNAILPTFKRLGRFRSATMPAWSDANSRWAFVADGANLVVVDIDPSSGNFLRESAASYTFSHPIRSLRLDKAARAYVLEQGEFSILDVTPFGGR